MSVLELFKKKPVERIDETCDLDDLIAGSVQIKLHGKLHIIRPITVKEFYAIAKSLANLTQLEKKAEVETIELLEQYLNLFTGICSTITRDDVEKMTQAQIAALLSIILDRFKPKKVVEEEKKKQLKA